LFAAQVERGERAIRFGNRYRHRDGTYRHLSWNASPDVEHGLVYAVATCLDAQLAAERSVGISEDRLRHAALHDPLTGLPNRTFLAERLGAALDRAGRVGQDVAVLFCDLDGFKRVNDAQGHLAGDRVLRETAQRLQALLRPQDVVARVGGDEFVIVVAADGIVAADGAGGDVRRAGLEVARRVIAALSDPVVLDGIECVVSASVGIAFAGGLSVVRTAAEMMRDADTAMYHAKARGKDRYEVFQNALRQDVAARAQVETQLRAALRPATPSLVPPPRSGASALSVAYQPVFRADTGTLEADYARSDWLPGPSPVERPCGRSRSARGRWRTAPGCPAAPGPRHRPGRTCCRAGRCERGCPAPQAGSPDLGHDGPGRPSSSRRDRQRSRSDGRRRR